jgi:type II secretory pathway component GspD/PulD (secretin)
MKRLRGAIPFASTFLRIALLSIALTYSGLVMAQSLEVVQLKFRTANEVIPVLQPMLESGGVLTGQDYQLFVRTSSQNLQQLKQAIAQLDREPRNLLVSVRQGTRSEMTKQGADASVQARAQNQNGTWRTGANASVQADAGGSRTVGDAVSSVRLLEGGSAFIATGTSVPVVSAVFSRNDRNHVDTGAAIEYHDVASGFAVTPRVNGSRVVLQIDQQSQHLEGGAIRSQSLGTEVSGALGEWIELGGVTESEKSRERGLTNGSYATNSDVRTLWVKVEAQ